MPRTQSQGRGNYRTRAYCSCFVQVCSLKVIGFFDRFDVGISFGDPELVYFGSFRVSGSMLDDERYTRMQYSLPPSLPPFKPTHYFWKKKFPTSLTLLPDSRLEPSFSIIFSNSRVGSGHPTLVFTNMSLGCTSIPSLKGRPHTFEHTVYET